MLRIVIVLAAIIPALLVLGYGIAKARGSWRSEAMWSAFFVGAVSALAALACELVLGHLVPTGSMGPLAAAAVSAVFVAAIPEETIKFFVLVNFCETHVEARRLQDVIVLAVAVSLGFAAVENFFYVASVGDWRVTATARAITAVPAHGIFGLAMGSLLVEARLSGNCKYWRIAGALVTPIVLHAAYDFPLFSITKIGANIWFGAGWIAVIVVSSVVAIVSCNRVLPRAARADHKSGRDGASTETTDRLIVGGIASLAAGPLLAAEALYAKGSDFAPAALALSVLPIALGIDAIHTGLQRRKARAERR
jgi:RsiW-degrading membrane proteinase PrsW (M82 family)